MYFFENGSVQCLTFSTVSDNLDHQAHGVWAHLTPIFDEAGTDFPDTKCVHFFSDSPSSQYRNRTNIYLMHKLMPKFFKNLQQFSWNFSEPGHGKGVMDGVGGSLKRNAHQSVLHGKDIMSAKDLETLFQHSKSKVIEIPSSSMDAIKKSIPKVINPIKEIMALRQIFWGIASGLLYGRRLSCFECAPNKKCTHFHVLIINDSSSSKDKPKEFQLKKTTLKVSDVYTSEDDSAPEDRQTNTVIEPTPFEYEDLKQGAG